MIVTRTSSNAEKIQLFRSLFVGRDDVVARRFENVKKGTSGYSPCCENQWGAGCVLKQHKKCSEVIMLDSTLDLADVESYRRARREDALLQSHGYHTLRFLAEDICERLDDVMDSINMIQPKA